MKVRTIIVILALTLSMVLLGQRSGTEAAAGTELGADMPVGSIVVYAGSTAPEGWLMCDGALYDVLAYPELFDILEFTYGSNAAKSAFRVPDLTGRVPVGAKPFTWYCDTLGKTGGEATVSLTESEMPAYKHNVSASSHAHGTSVSPHNHTVTLAPHVHNISDRGHTHGINDPGHIHGVNDPGHHHFIDLDDMPGRPGVDDAGESGRWDEGINTDDATTGISIRTHSTGIVVNSAVTGITVLGANVPTSVGNTTVSASVQSADVSLSEASKGSGAAHENLQPYLVLHYIIKSGIPGLSPMPVR
jgi:microcystin-dependent protein